jgi:predicted component of type VI protein secretion system
MMNDNSSVSDDYHNFESAPQGSDDTNLVAGNVSDSAPTWLIYLKTGTTYSVSDYWLQGGRLHYTVNYGAPSTLKMQEVDLQRTVDENARRGIGVLLKPHPSSVTSQPSRQNQASTAPATTPPPASDPQPQTSSQSQDVTRQHSTREDLARAFGQISHITKAPQSASLQCGARQSS